MTAALKKIKPKNRNIFARMHRVFEKNISLHEASIDVVGSYASKYDHKVHEVMDALFKKFDSQMKKSRKKSIVLSNTDFKKLMDASKKHPYQSELFIKNTFVSVLTTLDALFAKLFEYYYTENTSRLSPDNKTLTFGELKDLSNVAEAEKYLIRREVDMLLLRSGFKEKIKILTDDLGIDFPNKTEHVNFLLKAVKIRNLIVHNEAKIDSDFLKHYASDKAKVGDNLKISKEYLVDTLLLVYFIGGYILQAAQLKYSREPIGTDEYILNDAMHRLLKHRSYKFLRSLYDYAKSHNLDSQNHKMVVINYCIGLKKQGKDEDHIQQVLKEEDWTSVSADFRMALAALHGDDEGFYKYLSQLIKTKHLSTMEIDEWEIFTFYNKKKKFKDLVKGLK